MMQRCVFLLSERKKCVRVTHLCVTLTHLYVKSCTDKTGISIIYSNFVVSNSINLKRYGTSTDNLQHLR